MCLQTTQYYRCTEKFLCKVVQPLLVLYVADTARIKAPLNDLCHWKSILYRIHKQIDSLRPLPLVSICLQVTYRLAIIDFNALFLFLREPPATTTTRHSCDKDISYFPIILCVIRFIDRTFTFLSKNIRIVFITMYIHIYLFIYCLSGGTPVVQNKIL